MFVHKQELRHVCVCQTEHQESAARGQLMKWEMGESNNINNMKRLRYI